MTDSQEVVAAALDLAAQRVTGDELQAKIDARRHLVQLRAAVLAGGESIPSRLELTAALGDPDDAAIRHALEDLAVAGGQ